MVSEVLKGKSGKDSSTFTCILRVAEYECKDKVVTRRGSMKGFNQLYVLDLKKTSFEKRMKGMTWVLDKGHSGRYGDRTR